MSYFRMPGYYSRFACRASACSDSCCIGWEIDIDEETWKNYSGVGGAFGQLLAERIEPPCGEESAHIHLCEDERCPFLDENNLCEIYRTLGEEALSQICTDHPRFYEWYVDGTEAGLGLCCEAAAELILAGKTAGALVSEETEGESDAEDDEEESELLSSIEDWLFAAREELLDAVYSDCRDGLDALFDRIYETGEEIDRRYCEAWNLQDSGDESSSEGLYEADPADLCIKKNLFHYSEWFWDEENVRNLLKFYLNLEINDPVWSDILHELSANIKEILALRLDFLVSYMRQIIEYRRLLDYFLYRYFMKARFDDQPALKVHLALYAASTLILLGANEFRKNGVLSHERQIELCKLYSKEIEYNEENVEALSAYPDLTGGNV